MGKKTENTGNPKKEPIFSKDTDRSIGGAAVGMAFIVVSIFVAFNATYLINETVTTVVRWLFLLFGTPIALACLLNKAKCNSNRLAWGVFFLGLWLLLYLYCDLLWVRFVGLLLLFFAAFLILQELLFLIYSLMQNGNKKRIEDTGTVSNSENANTLLALITAVLGLALAIVQMLQQLGVIL